MDNHKKQAAASTDPISEDIVEIANLDADPIESTATSVNTDPIESTTQPDNTISTAASSSKYKCMTCYKTFVKKFNLDRHMKEMHGERFLCDTWH